MKIKFLKDYAINRGACPLEIGGFATLETEIVKADTVVRLEKDNRDDAFSDELVRWLINNGFAEEVKESGWWKPKRGDKYWYIGLDNFVHLGTWENSVADNGMLKLGLIFKTEEAGVYFRDYLEAVVTVKQDEGVLTPEQAAKNGYIYYIYIHDEFGLVVHGANTDYVSVNTVLFDTMQHAQDSLDKHLDEWKIIANYDWSRE